MYVCMYVCMYMYCGLPQWHLLTPCLLTRWQSKRFHSFLECCRVTCEWTLNTLSGIHATITLLTLKEIVWMWPIGTGGKPPTPPPNQTNTHKIQPTYSYYYYKNIHTYYITLHTLLNTYIHTYIHIDITLHTLESPLFFFFFFLS